MNDESKTRAQLLDELGQLRQRITELEAQVPRGLKSGSTPADPTIGQLKAWYSARGFSEREKMEDSFEQALEWQQAIFDGSVDAIFISNAESRFVAVNRAACELTGYTDAELLFMEIPALHETQDLEAYCQYHSRIMAGETIVSEVKILRKDGSKVDTEFNNRKVVIGNVPYMHTVARDISERKQGEQALFESVNQYRTLIEQSPFSIEIYDANGTMIHANRSWENYWKLNKAVAVNQYNVLKDPQIKDLGLLPKIKNAFAGESGEISETFFVSPDDPGQQRWLRTRYYAIKNSSGALSNVVVINEDITERKQAEEALRVSEERFRRAFSNAPIGMAIVGLDESLLEVNQALCEILGYSREELLTMTVPAITHPADQQVEARYKRQTRDGSAESFQLEKRYIRADGDIVWGQLSVSIVTDSQGQPLYFIGQLEDITERKRAEEALRKSQQQFKAFFSQSLDGCFFMMLDEPVQWDDTVDKEQTLDYVFEHQQVSKMNDAMLAQYGATSEQFIGLTPGDFFAHDLSHGRNVWRKFFDQGRLHIETNEQKLDGTKMWVEGEYVCLYDEHGRITGHFGIQRETTDRKRAEKALRTSEAHFRSLLESARNFVIYRLGTKPHNPLGAEVVFVSPSITDIMGVAAPFDFSGWLSNIHDEDRIRVQNANLQAAETGAEFDQTMRIFHPQKEEWRWVRAISTPVSSSKGKVKYYNGIIIDITERKQLEEQLLQAQKMEAVGRLAGGVAHDFNNILTVIDGTCDLIMTSLGKHDPMRRDVEQIRQSGQRAAALTRQLLAFSHKQVLQPEVLNLNKVITNIESMLRRLIREDIGLAILLEEGLGSVKADPGQIEQVILNLVVNARDAMPHGGNLMIETENVYLDADNVDRHVGVDPGRYIGLAASDTGGGMDDKTKARIFEPFFTTKERGEGTGLGLATVHGIVKQSGGHVFVRSGPGEGTTFKVFLPQVDEAAEFEKRPQALTANMQGSDTILLVEDEELVRDLIRRVLTLSGYIILEAGTGSEAIDICRNTDKSIDLLVTDVVMPGILSGPELAKQLEASYPDLKVLYISGYTDNALGHHGILDAKIDFLQKPFPPDVLLRKVREVLDSG